MNDNKKKAVKYTPGGGSDRGGLVWMIAGVVIVAVVVLGLVIFSQNKKDDAPSADHSPKATISNGVVAVKDDGVEFRSKDAAASKSAMGIDVYTDFRCPYCAKMEASSGVALGDAVSDGKAVITIRSMHFLDNMMRSDYSLRAVAAFRTVAAEGNADRAWKFHEKLMAEQPAETQTAHEWTNDEFADWAKELGASEETVARIRSGAEVDAAKAASEKAQEKLKGATGKIGSPAVLVADKQINADFYSSAAWLEDVLAQGRNTPAKEN